MKPTRISLAAICLSLSEGLLANDFWDNDIVNGHVRTEHESTMGTAARPLTLRFDEEGAEGCKFDSTDSFSGCPGRAGLPMNADDFEVWLGALQWNEACGGDSSFEADTWKGCLAYRQGNPYESGTAPSNYWMLTANNDPAFDQCNSGMPGTSHPVTGITSGEPGIFQFQVEEYEAETGARRHRFHFAISSTDHDFYCASLGDYQSSLPFLSVGAQNGAGIDGPIGVLDKLDPAGRQDRLRFEYEVVDHQPYACLPETRATCLPTYAGSHSGFFLLAEWDGVKRMLFVELWRSGHFAKTGYGPDSGNWNWPIEESVYYPGAEIATLPVGHPAVALCDLGLAPYTPADMGAPIRYEVSATELYICADALDLFSSALPEVPIELDGVHWFSESYGTEGYLWAMVDRIRLNGPADATAASESAGKDHMAPAPLTPIAKRKYFEKPSRP